MEEKPYRWCSTIVGQFWCINFCIVDSVEPVKSSREKKTKPFNFKIENFMSKYAFGIPP